MRDITTNTARGESDRATSDRAVSEGIPSAGEGIPSGCGGAILQRGVETYLRCCI
jgi:hypothetical protein